MKKRILTALLTICLALGFSFVKPVPVSARNSDCINEYYTSIKANGNGKLTIISGIDSLYNSTFTIDTSLEVYENGIWKYVTGWRCTGTGYYLDCTHTYQGTAGKKYRSSVYVTCKTSQYYDAKTVSNDGVVAD